VRIGRDVIIASWGIGGVVALIVQALVKLTPFAIEPIKNGGLSPWHWVVLVSWVTVNGYAEGLLGFHRKFSPRTVDRALYLGRNPSFVRVVFAPAFCMGLFDASPRTKIVGWTLIAVIASLVVLIRQLAQPWRGIVDAGVVVGLGLGLVSLIGLFVHGVVTKREPVLHEVPQR
jgi:hypothetical protein